MTTAAEKPRLYLLCAALAFGAALAAHLPALSGNLLWDDEQFLAANPFVTDCANLPAALNPVNLVKVLPVPMSARPAVNASLLADVCGGLGPRGMKVTNALLHAANAALLFFLLLLLARSVPGALLGALAFALHPAAAETVHIVTFRSHLLGLFFFTSGLLAALFFARRPSALTGTAAALAYFLGVLSVETAAVLPAAAALAVYFDSGRAGLRRCAPLLAAAVLIGAFYLWFRAPRSGYELPGSGPGVRAASLLYPAALFPADHAAPAAWHFPPPWREVYTDPAARLYTMSAITAGNLLALAFPYALSADYAPAVRRTASEGLAPLIACLGLLAAGVALFLHGRLPGLALLLIFTGLLPAMNLWPAYNLKADRYLYLALPGLGLLAAAAARGAALRRDAWRGLGLGAAALWLAWLGAETAGRGPQFYSTLSLFSAAAGAQPASPRVQATLGAALLREGDCAAAIPRFEAASALDPASEALRLRLAYALAGCGRAGAAKDALAALPESADRLYLYGLLSLRGDRAAAARFFKAALAQAPRRRDFYLALLLAQKKAPKELGAGDRADLERFRRRAAEAGLLF